MTILLSAGAGRGVTRRTRDFLERFIRERGIEPRIRIVRTGAEMAALARAAAIDEEALVVAGGGDGTASAVASPLAGSRTALGVLPLGTLNHFAKDLGIPLDLESAAHTLLTGRIVEVDVGEVNGRTFLNNSSLGLYPSIVSEREKWRRLGWNRWAALARASLSVFRRLRLVSVELDVNGERIARHTPFVFIGNNEYDIGTGRRVSRLRLDAGRLWICVAPDRPSRWEFLVESVRALLGRLRDDLGFETLSAPELWIDADRPRLRIALDGEVTSMFRPLHYVIRPRALRVVVPDAGGKAA